MLRPTVTAVAMLSVIGLVACPAPVQQQVVNTIPDAVSCMQDIISDVQGSIDIAKSLADCGMTIDQFIQAVKTWIDSKTVDGGVGAPPEQMQRAQQVLAAAQAYK